MNVKKGLTKNRFMNSDGTSEVSLVVHREFHDCLTTNVSKAVRSGTVFRGELD